jgi:hypothetical protein
LASRNGEIWDAAIWIEEIDSMTTAKTGNEKLPPKRKASPRKKSTDRKKLPRVKTGSIGRPSDFRQEYIQAVFELTLLGFTDAQLSEVFGISEVTLRSWKQKQPDFLLAMRKGKAIADARVARSLYNRAIGVSVDEWRESLNRDGQVVSLKTIKELPGDVHAQKFWLSNRQPDKWKLNQPIEVGETSAFSITIMESLKPEDDE